jgi:SAM-dependent methyltransferase
MSDHLYANEFFIERQKRTQRAAEIIVPIIIDIFNPNSVIDFGCANGIWLAEFKKLGIQEILGIDGYMNNEELLLISENDYLLHDLEDPFEPNHKFDIALSLEVAEHLEPNKSTVLIDSLINSSDIIVFSAAIPFQGGVNHKNEQWPDYWKNIFSSRNYIAVDIIRNMIWSDDSIPVWYKQNILCFINKSHNKILEFYNLQSEVLQNRSLSIVHPDLYISKINRISKLEEKIKKYQPLVIVKKIINDFRKKFLP